MRSGEAVLDGEWIVIRVAVAALPTALSAMPGFDWDGEGIRVCDAQQFARDVVNELNREEEDGTTPIHEAFDKAMLGAVENGSEGLTDGGAPDGGARE